MRITFFLYCGEIVDVTLNYIFSKERMNVFIDKVALFEVTLI